MTNDGQRSHLTEPLNPVNHKQFIDLINMLSLRNGGQLGPNNDEADEGVPSVRSISEQGELQRRFLDSFAEIMSRDKGGEHICSVALCESGDRRLDGDTKVSLFVARNNDFKNLDETFCNKLEGLLATIGASVYGELNGTPVLLCTQTRHDDMHILDISAVEEELWEDLLHYNQPRLNVYVKSLHSNLEAFKNAGSLASVPPYSTGSESLQDGNAEPTTCCDNPNIGPYSMDTHDAHMRLAQEHILELDNLLCSSNGAAQWRPLAEHTYSIRHMASLKILINSCPNVSTGRKLIQDIQLLGRFRSCLSTLVKAALRIPGFAKLSIILVQNLQRRSLSYTSPSLADVTMQHLGQALSMTTVKKFISKKWNVIKATLRFEQVQSKVSGKPLPTHAEVQLILYITRCAYSENMNREICPYIGCSRLPCFLCAAFINYFTLDGVTFRTRGSHRKIYPRWSIPDMDGLHDDMVMALDSALEDMQNLLRGELNKPIISTPHRPESPAEVTDDTDDE
ncbi:hypothetical protein F5J12DRAFT_414377 [Pisolithus orientalis]|uniref:uncharacterized protein n=1 Tax=Pisolithus orientalis TaxID=936130 RepID=UPI0022258DDF|nr:uncharacterized protein F5J12DRAFT_414377 [Pisolithus orientalis]KAI5994603.1 hypothetical protein F5J12DRAFT_414377 [Pisolithus orientalis]